MIKELCLNEGTMSQPNVAIGLDNSRNESMDNHFEI